MEEDLLRRAADLAERCERTASVTSTAFLTPAEQYALTNWARHRDCTLVLHGGAEGCERQVAFFLPFYLTPADFDPAEHLRAVQFSAPFAAPGHRDYLGAILGLGIRREWVGDILVQAHGAFVFCLPSVEPESFDVQLPRHVWFRLRNDRHVVSFWYSPDGRNWTKADKSCETSGYHHNMAGEFLSLRPGIYAAGYGEVVFRNFKYKTL